MTMISLTKDSMKALRSVSSLSSRKSFMSLVYSGAPYSLRGDLGVLMGDGEGWKVELVVGVEG